jgi:hypothetical protein
MSHLYLRTVQVLRGSLCRSNLRFIESGVAHLHCNTPALAGGARERSAAQVSGTPALAGGARENKNAPAMTSIFEMFSRE